MHKSKMLFSRLPFIFSVFLALSFSHKPGVDLSFKARFYDDFGVFIGDFGAVDDRSPVYIVSKKLVFPDRFEDSTLQMTANDIVAQVGTEILYDRPQPVNELILHAGIFKLPPKAHRAEMQKIIEEAHLDAQNPSKMDDIDYEIGGCGYHNDAGELIHLRAVDGQSDDPFPSVNVFNAVDFYEKVDSSQQLITERGSKLIYENRVEYTWHTHPPKLNPRPFEQTPSRHDFHFGKSYQRIKQHFLISLKFKSVYYFGYTTALPKGKNIGEQGGFNFKMRYETFLGME